MSRNGYGNACDVPLVTREIVPGVRINCHSTATEAFIALGMVMIKHNYNVRSKDTGNYNCRNVTGGSSPSAHSYGLATDVNWLTNPYSPRSVNRLVTDMPADMRADIKRIKTNSGKRIFEWGGDWNSIKDAMHWEIDVDARDMMSGVDWSTVNSKPFDPEDQSTWITIEQGDSGPTVKALQILLTANGVKVHGNKLDHDGDFGRLTAIGVRTFQRRKKLLVDTVVGPATWTQLVAHLPDSEDGEPGPTKLEAQKVPTEPVAVRWEGTADEGAARVLAEAYGWVTWHSSDDRLAVVNVGVGYMNANTHEYILGEDRDETAHMVQDMVNTARGHEWAAAVQARGDAGLSS